MPSHASSPAGRKLRNRSRGQETECGPRLDGGAKSRSSRGAEWMPRLDDKINPSLSTAATSPGVQPGSREPATVPLRASRLLYDMDACHGPTGVTRHALSQLERLIHRPEITLSVITGRITSPRRPGVLAIARGPSAAGITAAHARHPSVVANAAMAADRVVDRPPGLDLLPGRILCSHPQRATSGHQPRCVAGPPV